MNKITKEIKPFGDVYYHNVYEYPDTIFFSGAWSFYQIRPPHPTRMAPDGRWICFLPPGSARVAKRVEP